MKVSVRVLENLSEKKSDKCWCHLRRTCKKCQKFNQGIPAQNDPRMFATESNFLKYLSSLIEPKQEKTYTEASFFIYFF